MDDSFTQWRGGNKPSSKSENSKNSVVISDSEDEAEQSSPNRNNYQREAVIESSEGEDSTAEFENSRVSSNDRSSNRHSIIQSTNITGNQSKSSNNNIPDLDETQFTPEVAISRKKRTMKRIIIPDDSDEEVAHPSEEKDERSQTDSDVSNTSDDSKATDHSHDEDTTASFDESIHQKSHSGFVDSAADTSLFHKETRAESSVERDHSCLTISDTSGNDDASNASNYTDHTSGEGVNAATTSAIMTLVRKEIGVGNVDPMIAQQRAILTCNIEQVKSQLAKSKMLLNTANINLLPDKGEKLRHSADAHEAQLRKLSEQLESLPKIGTPKPKPKPQSRPIQLIEPIPLPSWESLPGPKEPKVLGQQALATQEREQALTEERIKDLHGSLNARPGEDERAPDPNGLKITLMPHQQHALAWLLWRERQRPHGGILADDMGLGKTLTMISLILQTLANDDLDDDSEDSDDEWMHRKKSVRPKGGTLVVCPASVLSQWETEINRRVRRGMLSVELFHGNHREAVPRRLAKNDVVITTYNLISREYRLRDVSILHEINWRRVILDEAHIVRNHKSQASEAVCGIHAHARWALTGTPIQNKELDLYALLKFLKCSPFDDLRVWKRWVDNKNAQGHERLATVMKTLMLRRTKQELQAKGGLGSLPDKNLEEINIKLDPEEQLVYEKVLVFSRTLFAQFLHQRAEKDHIHELHAGKFDGPTFLQRPKDTQFTKVQNQLLARHADVKAHDILVLLLRLRQICCHPALIHAMLDQEDLQGNDIVDEKGVNLDLMAGLGALNLGDDENIDPNEIGVDRRVVENLLTTKNPVFDSQRQSSKIRAVLGTIQEILDKGDKIVVVSQWTSMLEVVQTHLSSLNGATYDILSGKVPVKNRQRIVDSFNKVGSSPQILLLSLTAGGVGLNLVGGNHLLLLDIHWNPQLEAQAQDRIFRVGQKKSVYIYKFMCLDTVEQRIKALQDRKLAIAHGVLTGAGTAGASKLTLDDLKSLFSL